MDKQAAAAFVRRHGWLSRMPALFQDDVIARSDLLTPSEAHPIYHADDPPGGIFGVVTGRVELHYAVTGEGATLAYICGPGVWAGDTAAIAGRSRRLTLIAGSRCKLLRLPRSEMMRMTQQNPLNWRYFAELLAHNYYNTLDVIDALRRSDPVERIAMTVCNLLNDQPAGYATINASQADLGSMAQLGRGTVNAALSTLENRGLIRRGYATIEVVDVSALRGYPM